MKGTIKRERITIDRASLAFGRASDTVALDMALKVFINGNHFTTLTTSPFMLKELVVGHLITEGFADSLSAIIDIKGEKAYVELPTSPVRELPMVESDIKIEPRTIVEGVSKLSEMAEIFPSTGGSHAAALYNIKGELLVHAEDIGRHNAVDKVFSYALIKNCDLKRTFIASTARQSRSMVEKVARAGIPVIASRSAPINSGIVTAESTGITLICFVRGDRLNIYAHPERVSPP